MFFYRFIFNKVGKRSSILLYCEVRNAKNVQIGDNCQINQKILLDGRGGKIVIGNCVDLAQETNIWTLEHDVDSDSYNSIGADVVIEDYVWIASRVTILPGVTIGRGAVVASNSVVTKNVDAMSIVAGIPAKKIGERKSKLQYQFEYKPLFR